MDGTIANLYGEKNWLEDLQATNPRPYKNAKPMMDMEKLAQVCGDLIKKGHDVEVVSWLAKDSTREYDKEVRKAKREWLTKHGFAATKIHLVKYGTPKSRYKKGGDLNVLVDDDNKVRNEFESHRNCITLDPTTEPVIETLERIAATC